MKKGFELQLFAEEGKKDEKKASTMKDQVKEIVSTESEVDRAKLFNALSFEEKGKEGADPETAAKIESLTAQVEDLTSQLEKANQDYLDAFYNGAPEKKDEEKKDEETEDENKTESIDDIIKDVTK